MKTRNQKMNTSELVRAIESALLLVFALPAWADDAELAALKTPDNFVEIGVKNISASSAKFGEYNGLNKSGGSLIGNFSVQGGDAYAEGSGSTRWSVRGDDLGTTSRAFDTSVNKQGEWECGLRYDELRHNITDSYQTPYLGSMGDNSFTLPPGFAAISTAAPGTRASTAVTQLSTYLNTVDIASNRQNTALSAAYNFNAQWDIKFDFNQLQQTGAKLMGFGSMKAGGAAGVLGEGVIILPNPTNYKTDTINLALNWAGENGHMSGSYYGSFFRDGYDRVTFQSFDGAIASQTMSTAPGNDFHQLNLTGGYALSAKTKLTGGLSYGRNTQNDAYVVDAFMMVAPAPATSLNGVVVTTHGDLKMVNQTTRDLSLTAGIKYDERNNRTVSDFYNFHAIDGSASHDANFPSTPYSNSKAQLELAADYRLDKAQHIRLAYNRENVKRWCEQYAVNANYPAGTNCVVAYASKDDKLSATYKLKATENVHVNLGYAYSKRVTDSDVYAITARIDTGGNLPDATTIKGLNAGDFRGFYPFFSATRTQQMLKAGASWQASEKWDASFNARYGADLYDSQYGIQNGSSWSVNLDTSYVYAEAGAVTAYATQEHRQREMTDLQKSPYVANTASPATVPAGGTWTNKLRDDDLTIGVGVKHGGLMAGKLEFIGDLTYTLGVAGFGTQLNYALLSGPPCSDPSILSCGDLPDVKNTTIQLKLGGNYTVDKRAKLAVGYLYRYMESVDFAYNGMQIGYTPNSVMPSNQQAPNYAIHAVFASYSYLFK